ncbi:MAG: Aspartate 1-decarboxylase [Planctomycetota bacterium]|jgi:aspartate 1-decarboxylase
MRTYLRSKIHKATVTAADLNYIGSITIDRDLMDKADIAPFEKVLIVDNTNGSRIETYVIEGERGSGVMQINGGAAHLVRTGDEIIVMTFETGDGPGRPRQILVDKKNRYVRDL